MMNIGILTYHFSDNYGALMQAYALRQWFIILVMVSMQIFYLIIPVM